MTRPDDLAVYAAVRMLNEHAGPLGLGVYLVDLAPAKRALRKLRHSPEWEREMKRQGAAALRATTRTR